MAIKNYTPTSTFWALFHSLLRNGTDESIKNARQNCTWLTGELSIIRKVLIGIEADLIGIVYNHWITNREAPSIDILEEWLDANPNPEIKEALEEYKDAAAAGSYRQHVVEDLGALLNTKSQEAKTTNLDEIIQNMRFINSSGIELKKGGSKRKLKGPADAVRYLIEKLDSGSLDIGTSTNHGTLQESTEKIKEIYNINKQPDGKNKKIRTGILAIDEVVSIRKGHFVGVLGYAGQRKTSFCRSWIYNAALEGHNTLHITMEQSFEEELVMYAIIHSHHPKFGNKFNISVKNFNDGLLTKSEEDFLFNVALPDLENLPGKIIIRMPTEGTTWEAIKTVAEITDRITPLDIILIDYLTLSDVSYENYREHHNHNIKDAKAWCEKFRNGDGVLLITPVQGSRDGYDEASKNEGKWEMTGVYNFSEFDKSVDLMIYVYLNDDLKTDGQIIMGTCKSRRSDDVRPHKNAINLSAGIVSNLRKHSMDSKAIDDIIKDI